MVSLGLLVIRLIVGSIFVVHGYAKVFGGTGKGAQVSPDAQKLLGQGFVGQMEQGGLANVTGFMSSLGLPNPRAQAVALSAAELGGCLALILGWRTRLAALALTYAQVTAIRKIYAPNGLIGENGFETSTALIAATAGLTLAGPGKIALD